MTVWVANDQLTAIPGTRTMWHELLDLVPGSLFVAVDYPSGGFAAAPKPDLVIRPASYFLPLPVDCPQIVFFQEIHEVGSAMRHMAVEVASGASVIVWNSDYTKSHYPELAGKDSVVIPIGTDADLFQGNQPRWPCTLFVGAPSYVKGWPLLLELLSLTPAHRWLVVTKDPIKDAPDNCEVHLRVPHNVLPSLMSQCSLMVCTSEVETQHLAGIEAGLCGTPIVTRRVGAYANLEDGPWGSIVEHPRSMEEWLTKMTSAPLPGPAVRQFWLDAGYDLATWKKRWLDLLGRFHVGLA